jgi:hypothetical protein
VYYICSDFSTCDSGVTLTNRNFTSQVWTLIFNEFYSSCAENGRSLNGPLTTPFNSISIWFSQAWLPCAGTLPAVKPLRISPLRLHASHLIHTWIQVLRSRKNESVIDEVVWGRSSIILPRKHQKRHFRTVAVRFNPWTASGNLGGSRTRFSRLLELFPIGEVANSSQSCGGGSCITKKIILGTFKIPQCHYPTSRLFRTLPRSEKHPEASRWNYTRDASFRLGALQRIFVMPSECHSGG